MKKILGILVLIIVLVAILFLLLVMDHSSTIENLKLKIKNDRNNQLKTSNLRPSISPIKNREQDFKTKLYNLINAYRKENNLSPLLVWTNLELSADYKLNDMLAKNYWQHEDNRNRPPWQFFEQAGYNYKKAGENLGFNQKSAFSVFAAWTKSLKHNEQLLNPDYEHMGLAVNCQTLKKLDGQLGCIVVLHLGKL